MSEFIKKLRAQLYKTAYSPLYECYVAIIGVYENEDGEPLVKARLAGTNYGYIIFRPDELTKYGL